MIVELSLITKFALLTFYFSGKICYLSDSLFKMTHLTSLYLNGNSIKRLPPEIVLLSNLQHLNVSNNLLTTLPPKMEKMQSLRELILKNNYIVHVPTELGMLFNLCIFGKLWEYYLSIKLI